MNLEKYEKLTPRYAIYPSVHDWKKPPSSEEWFGHLRKSLEIKPESHKKHFEQQCSLSHEPSWSLYIHIPFCESYCTFCGCNTIITKDHQSAENYIKLLHKELDLYLEHVPELKSRSLKEIYLGGGTPTFLNEAQFERLLGPLYEKLNISKDVFSGTVEVDPRVTTRDQILTLIKMRFKNFVIGVQDLNPEILRTIHRTQSFSLVESVVRLSRESGAENIALDLIYGLPKQTAESFQKTLDQAVLLSPDRILLYGFLMAHWMKAQQRLFKDDEIPKFQERFQILEAARNRLSNSGYFEISSDLFVRPGDKLWKAVQSQSLHRNYVGYTDHKTDVLLGLGVSSISESKESCHQNEKVFPMYMAGLEKGRIPSQRGHIHCDRDQAIKRQIYQLLTQGRAHFLNSKQRDEIIENLEDYVNDELVELTQQQELVITHRGRPFVRNIAVLFDPYRNFSRTVL